MNSNLPLTATFVATTIFFLLSINTTKFSSPPPSAAVAGTWKTEFVTIDGAIGPESFAFDPLDGGPYTGVSDGRIIKWQPDQRKWVDFAVTSANRTGCEGGENEEEREERCGRPLGLRFRESDGRLYIADAYRGLLSVASNGGLAHTVASLQNHEPFHPLTFTNGLDIHQPSGPLYFTDSSSHYQRRNYVGAILSGDETGRLMKYDPESKQLNVLLGNLSFPNGVLISKNGEFLLLAETTKCRILKYWLNNGTFQVFAKLPGFPDNIKSSSRGGFWVGIHSRKRGFLRVILDHPWIGKALMKLLPLDIMRVYSCLGKWIGSAGLGIRLSDEGEVMEIVEGNWGVQWSSISEVEEREDGVLWIGSIATPFAAILKM